MRQRRRESSSQNAGSSVCCSLSRTILRKQRTQISHALVLVVSDGTSNSSAGEGSGSTEISGESGSRSIISIGALEGRGVLVVLVGVLSCSEEGSGSFFTATGVGGSTAGTGGGAGGVGALGGLAAFFTWGVSAERGSLRGFVDGVRVFSGTGFFRGGERGFGESEGGGVRVGDATGAGVGAGVGVGVVDGFGGAGGATGFCVVVGLCCPFVVGGEAVFFVEVGGFLGAEGRSVGMAGFCFLGTEDGAEGGTAALGGGASFCFCFDVVEVSTAFC